MPARRSASTTFGLLVATIAGAGALRTACAVTRARTQGTLGFVGWAFEGRVSAASTAVTRLQQVTEGRSKGVAPRTPPPQASQQAPAVVAVDRLRDMQRRAYPLRISDPVSDLRSGPAYSRTGTPMMCAGLTPAMCAASDDGTAPPVGLVPRLKAWIRRNSPKMDRESLKAMGAAMLLSYGFVSNASYMACLSVAWFLFSTRTGLSPLAEGQKPAFLAVYAGLVVLQNVIRPVRFAASVALSPSFDRLIDKVMDRFKMGKAKAMAVVVFSVNVVGTFALMFGGIALASLLSGVPVWAK